MEEDDEIITSLKRYLIELLMFTHGFRFYATTNIDKEEEDAGRKPSSKSTGDV